jgi:AraC-like DNA-binding protein
VVTVLHGGSGRYVDDVDGPTPLPTGTVSIIPPQLPHWYGTEPDGTWTETWAMFRGPLFTLLRAGNPAAGAVRRAARPNAAAALPILLGRPARSQREGERQLLDLFAWLRDAITTGAARWTEPVQAAADRLAADTAAQLSIADVADQVGMDYDAFRHAFVREVGTPPAAYRNTHRLQTAAKLLRMTAMTHRAIARELGYTDEFHFSRRFRAAFGESPSAYRKRP